jgi:hypothetical protein
VPAKKKAPTQQEVRTLLVFENGGNRFKIDIPVDWKITFGAFQQGKYGGEGGYALRIYESENKQRACFTNVRSFRDLSLPITRFVKTEEGQESWVTDSDGNVTSTKSRKVKVTEVSGV